MTILKTVHELHKKLSNDRFSDEISFEEFLNKYEGELCVISEQTGLNASAAMLLAGIIIATVSDPLPKNKFLINASRIARELSVFKFEVLLNHRLFTTLEEKGFIEMADYYLEELNEDSAFTLCPGIPSKIKFLNKKFELTDDYAEKLMDF